MSETTARNEQSSAEEQANKYGEAKRGYLILKQNFDELGDYDAASWAYRKERCMEKLEAWYKARASLQGRKLRTAAESLWKVFWDLAAQYTCDYGENARRVILWMFGLVFVITPLVVAGLGGLEWTGHNREYYYQLPPGWHRLRYGYLQLLLYSLDTLTTSNFAELRPATDGVRLASGLLAVLGIFFAGLLGFVAGNRIRRS